MYHHHLTQVFHYLHHCVAFVQFGVVSFVQDRLVLDFAFLVFRLDFSLSLIDLPFSLSLSRFRPSRSSRLVVFVLRPFPFDGLDR